MSDENYLTYPEKIHNVYNSISKKTTKTMNCFRILLIKKQKELKENKVWIISFLLVMLPFSDNWYQ